MRRNKPCPRLSCPGFNPFFIRASVYWAGLAHEPALQGARFNPFFIRASVYCKIKGASTALERQRFNPFFIRASVYWDRLSLDATDGSLRFNPFFIRASVYWRRAVRTASASRASVSIPSSSGHQFTDGRYRRRANRARTRSFNPFFIRASVYCVTGNTYLLSDLASFNPFFIRASVYWRRSGTAPDIGVTKFQSLLHQGISLLATPA